MVLRDFDFSHSTFWVQIYGLPLQFMNKKSAFKIGGLFQKVVRCEDTSKKNIRGLKFMRIQVEVNISKPLPTGFFQKVEKGKSWIQFCYEHLSDFCYNCGIQGYVKKSCKVQVHTSAAKDGDAYGVWLRVEEGAFSVFSKGDHL